MRIDGEFDGERRCGRFSGRGAVAEGHFGVIRFFCEG